MDWLKKQFEIGWSRKDTVRAIWVFATTFGSLWWAQAGGALKEFITNCQQAACDVPSVKAAAVAAAIAAFPTAVLALKNFVLKDRSALKG